MSKHSDKPSQVPWVVQLCLFAKLGSLVASAARHGNQAPTCYSHASPCRNWAGANRRGIGRTRAAEEHRHGELSRGSCDKTCAKAFCCSSRLHPGTRESANAAQGPRRTSATNAREQTALPASTSSESGCKRPVFCFASERPPAAGFRGQGTQADAGDSGPSASLPAEGTALG